MLFIKSFVWYFICLEYSQYLWLNSITLHLIQEPFDIVWPSINGFIYLRKQYQHDLFIFLLLFVFNTYFVNFYLNSLLSFLNFHNILVLISNLLLLDLRISLNDFIIFVKNFLFLKTFLNQIIIIFDLLLV